MPYWDKQLNEEKVFKDPVHRYIHVRDQVIWDLIGTKEFQRLRRIKQLGTTFFTSLNTFACIPLFLITT